MASKKTLECIRLANREFSKKNPERYRNYRFALSYMAQVIREKNASEVAVCIDENGFQTGYDYVINY